VSDYVLSTSSPSLWFCSQIKLLLSINPVKFKFFVPICISHYNPSLLKLSVLSVEGTCLRFIALTFPCITDVPLFFFSELYKFLLYLLWLLIIMPFLFLVTLLPRPVILGNRLTDVGMDDLSFWRYFLVL